MLARPDYFALTRVADDFVAAKQPELAARFRALLPAAVVQRAGPGPANDEFLGVIR